MLATARAALQLPHTARFFTQFISAVHAAASYSTLPHAVYIGGTCIGLVAVALWRFQNNMYPVLSLASLSKAVNFLIRFPPSAFTSPICPALSRGLTKTINEVNASSANGA
jgi:hypothetical protein